PKDYWGTSVISISQDENILFENNEDYINTQKRLLELKEQHEEQVKAEEIKATQEQIMQEQIKAEQARIAEQERIIAEMFSTEPEILKKLFPPSIVTGTMRYDYGGFKAGQQVEVKMAEKEKAYYVGPNTTWIPWDSISIPLNTLTQYSQATTEQIEAFINSQGLRSNTSNLVWIDLYRQRTYVFKRVNGQWKLSRNMLCSSGKNITPTVRGTFKVTSYVDSFGWGKGYVCYDAIQFWGEYLIHSILYDPTGTYLLEDRGILGQRASDGCVRLSPEDANWFFSNMRIGTTIWIN
ncbi:hypothetical protein AN639_05905, partial [Candidatus Epulonipiscium fishelsonii]